MIGIIAFMHHMVQETRKEMGKIAPGASILLDMVGVERSKTFPRKILLIDSVGRISSCYN